VGIHRLLRSTCCFLGTNTAITRQLIQTARMLEAEWWQVCGEARVRGQRKMSQLLGTFGLLDLTMLRPVLAWRAFWNSRTVYFFNFPNFFSGRGKPRILNPRKPGFACIMNNRVYRIAPWGTSSFNVPHSQKKNWAVLGDFTSNISVKFRNNYFKYVRFVSLSTVDLV